MTTTVRISERSHEMLRQLAEQKGISMVEALDLITEDWERQQFFQSLNESFAALKANPEAWQEELDERRLWDRTLTDDLEDNDEHTEAQPGRDLAY